MTEHFDVFFSYNRLDRRVVEPLALALHERKLKVFKDDWYLQPGEFWPAALERKLADSGAVVVAVGRNGLGAWQQREAAAALDRHSQALRSGNPAPPVIPMLLEQGIDRQAGLAFLLQHTWVEGWDPRAADLIAGAVRGKAPAELYDESHADPRARISPYRGLGVFREEDAAFYFGREPDVDHLSAAVERYPFVAIVGASGSGKSSLARAGLIPRLRRSVGGRVWQVAAMVPGSDPFLALARTLLPLREPERVLSWSKGIIDDECERLGDHLAHDCAAHLSHVAAQVLVEEPGTTHLLLLVDQWEELYTYRPTDAAAARAHAEQVRRFIQMLLDATRRGQPLRALLTLRADYWGEVLNHEPLAARLPDEAIIHLRALDRAALERIICDPAQMIRLPVGTDLTEVLLDDAVGQPGDLPLLEFALQHLWLSRANTAGAMTLAAYRTMGGLAKAIVSRADAVYDTLEPHEQEAVPGVFAALVQVGEVRTDLRRRARLKELSEAGQAVARRLADERLLVTSRDWTTGDELVEVAHEALLRHWPKLEEWIDQRRGALLTIRQLQADTRTWLERQKNASYQWSHERVREAVAALRQVAQEVRLGKEEKEFLGPIDPEQMLAELERPETSHRRRALIGERLDILGDPRPAVGIDASGAPSIEWCRVPGGEGTISILSDPSNRDSKVEHTPPKTIETFQIARFPITVAQYRAFIEAQDGWRDPAWGDDLYRDPEGNTYEFGRFGNHPAVHVSWFDAVAFCCWLSRRLGFIIRLPDELEWQQAATGGDPNKIYPWNDPQDPQWDPRQEPCRANTSESRLGSVTAVGMYPAGASPHGVLDMAGTVWEWCRNKVEAPEVTRSGACDIDPRALRGGSWLSDRVDARSAYRVRNNPRDRSHNVGFRVATTDDLRGQEIAVKLLPGEAVLHIEQPRINYDVLDFPTPTKALLRLTRVSRKEDIGKNGPPVSALPSLANKDVEALRLYEVPFGREALFVARTLKDIHPLLLSSTITFLAENQGIEYVDPREIEYARHREEELGRIGHEFRTKGWYWPYYGSVDATPLYVSAISEQIEREGIDFLKKTYIGRDGKVHAYEDSLRSALDWIKRRLDSNTEGLLEFKPLRKDGMENQGWKDSWDCYHHANGELANRSQGIASIEVQAYAYDALMQASELYKTLAIQKPEYLGEVDDLKNKAENLKTQVLTHFWVEDEKGAYFAIGTDRDEKEGNVRPLKIRTSNMGHLLNSNILSGVGEEIKGKREAIVNTLFSDEMLSPNGIRTLGKNAKRFRPGSYHNGSVWLWDNYYIALGLEKCGYIEHANIIYATIVADIKRAKKYIEFVRGGEAAEPLLNDKIIDIWDSRNNTENRVEQLPQELQAFTVAAAVAIEHKTGKGCQ